VLTKSSSNPTLVPLANIVFSFACAACHGTDGSGRDAIATHLEDSWGQPATPTDLRGPSLRSGKSLEAIYRVLLTGIEGTPMPSFAEGFTEEQRWKLVAFVAHLRRAHTAGK
jgi:mono/diheme cytochrome c family protein